MDYKDGKPYNGSRIEKIAGSDKYITNFYTNGVNTSRIGTDGKIMHFADAGNIIPEKI